MNSLDRQKILNASSEGNHTKQNTKLKKKKSQQQHWQVEGKSVSSSDF